MHHILGAVIRLTLLPALGIWLARSGKIPKNGSASISAILIEVGYPALVLLSFWQIDFRALWRQSALAAVAAAAATVLLYFVGKLVFARHPKRKAALYTFMLGIGNVVFVGVPVMESFLLPEAMALVMVYSSVCDIFLWTMYYSDIVAADPAKEGKSRLAAVFNPCVICMLAGMALSLLGVGVPAAVLPTLSMVAGTTAPLALLFIGMTFAGCRLTESFKNKKALIFSFIKVLGIPLLALPVFLLVASPGEAILLAAVLGCPSPLMALVWAEQDGGDDFARDSLIISTPVYFVVVPLVLLAASRFGLIVLK